MGLATIVSGAPFPVTARLINREPAYLDVKPALQHIQFLVVRDGMSRFYVPEEFTPINKTSHIYIPTMGEALAEELVHSNVQGTPHIELMEAAEGGCQPCIFWVPGSLLSLTPEDMRTTYTKHSDATNQGMALEKLKKTHPGLLDEFDARQNNWYERLVKDADDKWQKYRMNVVISEIERHAARRLNIKRDWMVKLESANLISCPFCTTLISPLAIICPNCREVLNAVRYEELKSKKSA